MPEYDFAAKGIAFAAIEELSAVHAPSLRLFPRRPMPRVSTSRVTLDDGGIVRIDPTSYTDAGEFDIQAVVSGGLDKLVASLDAAAQRRAKALVGVWQAAADQVTEATGNVYRGSPSWESLMTMLDRMPVGFDEDGNPTFKIVAGPAAADAFANLPEPTLDQRAAWDALMERKRNEFSARQRHRRLS